MLNRRTKKEKIRRLFYLHGRLMSKSARYLWAHGDTFEARMRNSELQSMYFERALAVMMRFMDLTR